MLLQIINDFLDIGRLAAGELALAKADFELADVTGSALSLLAPLAEQKDILLLPAVADGVPRRLVGDPVRLRQILVNLLGNAIKFTRSGTVRLSVSEQSQQRQDVVLRFDVIDTGIGIAPAVLPHLFAPYFQVRNGHGAGPLNNICTGGRTRGSGLGLTISKRLAEHMGGRIDVSSTLGKGSHFSLTVPLGTPTLSREFRPVKLQLPVDLPGDTAHSSPRTDQLRGRHILVVDDMEAVQQVALEQAGMLVDLVDNGYEAINRLSQARYDAIVMDVQMPGIDGCETTRRIRALPVGIGLPIMAVTASTSRAQIEACREAGMDGVVSKPVRPALLRQRIARLLAVGCDFDYPRSELGWTRQMLVNQLRLFVALACETRRQLHNLEALEDCAQIEHLAHNLKGTARAFRADALLGVIEAVEDACHDGVVCGLIEEFDDTLAGTMRAAEAQLKALCPADRTAA